MDLKLRAILYIVAVLVLVQGVAGAVSVTEEPSSITRGDQVTIGIQGLENDSYFSLKITGDFVARPGSEFSFQIRNFNMPFSLVNSNISATLIDTQSNTFSVKKGDTEVRKVGTSHNGVFSANQTMNITKGTFDYLSFSGVAASGAESVTADLSLNGTKEGPDDSVIIFQLDGVSEGTVRFTVLVDGRVALSKNVVVSSQVGSGEGRNLSGDRVGLDNWAVDPDIGDTGAVTLSASTKTENNIPGNSPTKAGTGMIMSIAGILSVIWFLKRGDP